MLLFHSQRLNLGTRSPWGNLLLISNRHTHDSNIIPPKPDIIKDFDFENSKMKNCKEVLKVGSLSEILLSQLQAPLFKNQKQNLEFSKSLSCDDFLLFTTACSVTTQNTWLQDSYALQVDSCRPWQSLSNLTEVRGF